MKDQNYYSKIGLTALVLFNPFLLSLGSQGDFIDLGLILLLSLYIYFSDREMTRYQTIIFSTGILWKQIFWLLAPNLIINHKKKSCLQKETIITLLIFIVFSFPFLFMNLIPYILTILGLFSIFREVLIINDNWWNIFGFLLGNEIPSITIYIVSFSLLFTFLVSNWYLNYKEKLDERFNIIWLIGSFSFFYYSTYSLYFVWITPFLVLIVIENRKRLIFTSTKNN